MAQTTKARALADWSQKKMGYKRTPSAKDRDFLYELRKKAISHNLTPEQHQEALKKIADELGV